MITHGESKTKLNKVWRNMKDRCFNPNNSRYAHYGLRGISVCDEWRNDYASFRDWAKANGYSEGLSIDRMDNNGDYAPYNCRWVNSTVQNNNFSRNRLVSHNGLTLSISQWSKKIGVNRNTIDYRLKSGMSPSQALRKINYNYKQLNRY